MDDLLLEYEGSKPSTPTERERRRRLAATVTICGLAFVGIGQLSTGAWFSDQGTANMQFTTGDVQIQLDGDPADPSSTARNLVLDNVNNMAPGDRVFQSVELTNSGSLRLRYAVTGESVDSPGSGGGDLSNVLDYDFYAVPGSSSCNAAGVAALTPLVSSKIGQSETALIGDKNDGPQAGDREVAVASSEWLCVRTSLPGASTGNQYAGSRAQVTLTFHAVQTANNN